MKKLKVFLFSDHRAPASLPLDAKVLAATGALDPTVAWIPSGGSPEKTDAFFAERCSYYSAIGVNQIEMCRFGYIPVPQDLTSLASLGLVDFDFHPHFGRYGASLDQLKAYSKNKDRAVYAVQDDGGLAAVGSEVLTHGNFVHIIDGKEMNESQGSTPGP